MIDILICCVVLFASSYGTGELFAKLNYVPRISGHIVAGLIVGAFLPSHFGESSMVATLISVSIAVVGTAAGSELRLSLIAPRWKEVVCTIMLLVLILPTAGWLCFKGWSEHLVEDETGGDMQLAALAGIVLLTRSPACAIGVIKDTRAQGPLSSVALATALALDATVVTIFSVAVPIVTFPNNTLLSTIIQVSTSLVSSALLSFILSRIILAIPGKSWLLIAIQIIPFVLEDVFDLPIEPLLTTIASSCIASHASSKSPTHSQGMTYLPWALVALFSIAGCRVNILSLFTTRMIVIGSLLIIRVCALMISTIVASKLFSPPATSAVWPYRWMCLVTQGGVCLAMVLEVSRRFPKATFFREVLLGVIAVNLCIGSAAFKFAIVRCGEQGRAVIEDTIAEEEGGGGDDKSSPTVASTSVGIENDAPVGETVK